jgi:diguanylate cyclase (GGDEF)-like protein/PAS domain S-box-containing protein
MKITKKHQKTWLNQFLHNSHIGVLVLNKKRKVLFVNEYLCSLLGYEVEEILHHSTKQFHISKESYKAFKKITYKAMQKNNSISIDYPCKHKNGKTIWVHVTGDLLEDQDEILWRIEDITQRLKSEKKIRHLKDRLELAMEANKDVVWDYDIQKKKLFISNKWQELVGYEEKDLAYSIKNWRKYLHPNDRVTVFKELNETIEGKRKYLDNVHRIQHSNGSWIWIHLTGKVKFDTDGKPIRIIGTHRDITQKKILRLEIAQQAKIIEQIHDSVISVDLEGKILSWNRGSEHLLGYTAKEIIGKDITMIFTQEKKENVYALMDILKKGEDQHLEVKMLKKSKKVIVADLSLSTLRNEQGEIIGMIGYAQDITQRVEAQEQLLKQKEVLQYHANYDALTKLPNRFLFQNRLKEALPRAKRNNKSMALFFIDLDHFKEINDTLGHEMGDEVLKEASKRLKSVIREVDTLARLGGDEFTVILEDLIQKSDISAIAQKITHILSSVMHIDGHELYISSSIGISVFPDDATNTKDLIRYADAAMYRAKENGRNNFQYYSKDMIELASQRLEIEIDLHEGLKEKHFIVHYQPQMDGKRDQFLGMEALVRWEHPQKGILFPRQFLDVAIDTNLILELDKYVMRTAMLQFASWYKQGLYPGRLALNISMKQLYEKNFLEEFTMMLEETQCKPQWIELELTENQMMKDPDSIRHILAKLKTLGIMLTIDDFGIGYTSLNHLKTLPISKIKIDRSFINNIPEDKKDVSIVKSIISLAKNLNLDVIAEGISTEIQKDFIVEQGCCFIQGYYYSKALSAIDMEIFLKENSTHLNLNLL